MSLLLTPKLSFCLQNRWRVIMPGRQTPLTAQCILLFLIKARGKSLLNTRRVNRYAGIKTTSPLSITSWKHCPLYHICMSPPQQYQQQRTLQSSGLTLTSIQHLHREDCLRLPLLQSFSFNSDFQETYSRSQKHGLGSQTINPSSFPVKKG